MKKWPQKRGLGTFLIIIAILGMIFSIFGIAVTWYYRPRIQTTIFGIIDSLDETLVNTNDGLVILDSSLEIAELNLEMISDSLGSLNATIDNIAVSLDSSADLIGGDLRDTLVDTQTALRSAASSAGLVDNTLRFIAAIPLLGADYRPEVPLSLSLEQVAESLDDVPEAFLEIELLIRDTEDSMVILNEDVTKLAEDINTYESDLLDAQEILAEYRQIIDDLRAQLSDLRQHTENFLLITSILSTGGFFLLGLAQLDIWQIGKNYRDGVRVSVTLSEIQRE